MIFQLHILALVAAHFDVPIAKDTSLASDSSLQFLPKDPSALLQGIPQLCIENPVANEHICQAWIDAILANNL